MQKGVVNKIGDFYQYDVRAIWDSISGGVRSILSEDPEWLTLRSEDVYGLCVSGIATVWGYSDYFIGDVFCITKIDVCPYRTNKTLQLLIAWSTAGDPEVADKFNELATLVAEKSGCDGIEIWTSSEKLSKYAGSKGYDKVMYVCRRTVNRKPKFFKDQREQRDTKPTAILGIVQGKDYELNE